MIESAIAIRRRAEATWHNPSSDGASEESEGKDGEERKHASSLEEIVKKVRMPEEVRLRKTLHLHTKHDEGSEGEARFPSFYKITPFDSGEGSIIRYLITSPRRELVRGNDELCLVALEEDSQEIQIISTHPPDDNRVIKKLAGAFGVPLSKEGRTPNDVWRDIIMQHIENRKQARNPLLYGVIPPIDAHEFAKIGDRPGAAATCMHPGYEVAEVLDLVFRAYIPDPSPLNSEEMTRWMKYQPHAIMFTNSGCGKSHIAVRLGIKYDQVRAARLLGFSSAKDVSPGDLHRKVCPVFLDEIAEERDDRLFGALLNYMEVGTSLVGKGKESLTTKGTTPLVFMGNPKTEGGRLSTAEHLTKRFIETLHVITDNYTAFSRRTAIIVFDEGMPGAKKVKGYIFDDRRFRLLLQQFKNHSGEIYSNLLRRKEVFEWLETEHDPAYITQLEAIEKSARGEGSSIIKQFLKGQHASHRHVRGSALRLASVDLMGHDPEEIDLEEALGLCEHYYHDVCAHNVGNLQRLVSGIEHECVIKEVRLTHLREKASKGVRGIVFGIVLAHVKGKDISTISYETLRPYVDSARDLLEKGDSAAQIRKRLKTRHNSVKSGLFRYGIRVIDEGNDFLFLCDVNEVDGLRKAIGFAVEGQKNVTVVTQCDSEEKREKKVEGKEEGEERTQKSQRSHKTGKDNGAGEEHHTDKSEKNVTFVTRAHSTSSGDSNKHRDQKVSHVQEDVTPVTLPVSPDSRQLDTILSIIRANGSATTHEISKESGLGLEAVEEFLEFLLKRGEVTDYKSGRYSIT